MLSIYEQGFNHVEYFILGRIYCLKFKFILFVSFWAFIDTHVVHSLIRKQFVYPKTF